jgi:hypothetical protein
MDFWEYLLEYLKVLAWPVVVSVALVTFRKQIGEKIKSLRELDTPLGTSKWGIRRRRNLRSTRKLPPRTKC